MDVSTNKLVWTRGYEAVDPQSLQIWSTKFQKRAKVEEKHVKSSDLACWRIQQQ